MRRKKMQTNQAAIFVQKADKNPITIRKDYTELL